VKDPQGIPLKRVLLQVIDSDAEGAIMLRARRDTERIDISDERKNKFLLVWCPEDTVLGEVDLAEMYDEFQTLKARMDAHLSQKEQLERDIDNVRRDFDTLTRENKEKTEALRVLQKERDPERFTIAVAQAIKERTASLEDQIRQQAADKVAMQREIDELKASKRRLKEANERLKDGRSK